MIVDLTLIDDAPRSQVGMGGKADAVLAPLRSRFRVRHVPGYLAGSPSDPSR